MNLEAQRKSNEEADSDCHHRPDVKSIAFLGKRRSKNFENG